MQSNIYDLQNNQSSDAYPGSSQILKTFIVMSMSIGCAIVQLFHIIILEFQPHLYAPPPGQFEPRCDIDCLAPASTLQ
jgi:hypothetical protein